jgi:hypothetical protein
MYAPRVKWGCTHLGTARRRFEAVENAQKESKEEERRKKNDNDRD